MSFKPFIYIQDDIGKKEKSLYEYLGVVEKNPETFETIVPFNEYMQELNSGGYHLFFGNDEINTYEEYFNKMKEVYYNTQLTMKIDFSDNNIKR